jgi:tetratricopeptide (TPR) repeat protein
MRPVKDLTRYRAAVFAACLCLAAALVPSQANAVPLSHAQALRALQQPAVAARLAALDRLHDIGTMADANAVLQRLTDASPPVRAKATAAIWQIWGRSGDRRIDALLARGAAQMQQRAFDDALATFNDVVQRKPDFAEGWNQRATLYFLMGQNDKSLADCDQVFRLNPQHFGALSGAALIHQRIGQPGKALDYIKQALVINPNLHDLLMMVPSLEKAIEEAKGRSI